MFYKAYHFLMWCLRDCYMFYLCSKSTRLCSETIHWPNYSCGKFDNNQKRKMHSKTNQIRVSNRQNASSNVMLIVDNIVQLEVNYIKP